MPTPFTLIYPYYNQPQMLEKLLAIWEHYLPEIPIILVDDGSQHSPAFPVVQRGASAAVLQRLRLYRILVDIPWARSTARNLGASEATTDWIVQCDLDHVLHPLCAARLLDFTPDSTTWYRFSRYRRGQADETRNKDALPRTCAYGPIHPHMDSYLIERTLYWQAGGYDEQTFNGALGGGSEFLQRLGHCARVAMLPETIFLEVWTRHMVPDASVTGLSRETSEYSRRRKDKARRGDTVFGARLCLPWERVL